MQGWEFSHYLRDVALAHDLDAEGHAHHPCREHLVEEGLVLRFWNLNETLRLLHHHALDALKQEGRIVLIQPVSVSQLDIRKIDLLAADV